MDNQKTNSEGLPGCPEIKRKGIPWTQLLADSGMEAPGYHETIKDMKAAGRIKQSR